VWWCDLVTECLPTPIDDHARARAATFVVPHATQRKRVVVALSGGVDSAVAAWLLQQAGHEVIGVSLRLAPDDDNSLAVRHGRCCSHDDMTDARQVADRLGMRFYAIDARSRFREAVFEPFVAAYRRGETPIPCLACNHEVKLGDLWATARDLDASLATGHYVRKVMRAGVAALARPVELARDQSYYLYGTPHDIIEHLEFPLGDLDKPLVRALAEHAKLPVASKPDSQEICFVPDGDHAKIVERASGPMPAGELVHINGKPLGKHAGIHHFTVGQRRGTGVASPEHGQKLYVIDVNADNQRVSLGPREALACHEVEAQPLRIAHPPALWPSRVFVQVRARHQAQAAAATIEGGVVRCRFEEPVSSVAIGQALVIYDDAGVVLGGGIISARLDGAAPRRTQASA
jgi:tRNA-uridine 2-sulfurtransferase